MIEFKEDGSQWYNYFFIRYDPGTNFYFAWIGTKRKAFPEASFASMSEARYWIVNYCNWREAVDKEFEKEVLNVEV